MVIESASAKETFEFAKELGENAKGGEIYCLNGELGTGKTVFAQGFAAGLGIKEQINSPTYTIVQEYHSGRLPLYHFDVYRINDVMEMDDIGYSDYFFGQGVCLVEWGDLIKTILPNQTKRITIAKSLEKNDNYRKITYIK